jgi:hypothetical protein
MTILETPPFDVAVTDRLLATTRSVRKRLDLSRPVEPEVIMECLNLAVQAPTASGVQRWRWLIVTDPEKRAALADLYREGNVEFQKMMAGNPHHESDAFYESANFLIDHLQEVPVHVVPCIVGRAEGRSAEGAIALYASIMPAAWSFMLACAHGASVRCGPRCTCPGRRRPPNCWASPTTSPRSACCRWPTHVGTEFKAANRQPADEVTYWNTWENVRAERLRPCHPTRRPPPGRGGNRSHPSVRGVHGRRQLVAVGRPKRPRHRRHRGVRRRPVGGAGR